VLGHRAQALHIPGHTLTAVAFYFPDQGLLFTGDTLFGAGCGRLFEGTPAQMHASLKRLAALPGSVRVYCGHEYTQKNLSFAAQVEPENTAITERRERVDQKCSAGRPSVPSTIIEELQTNPFLRVGKSSVHAAAANRPAVDSENLIGNDVEVFARIRMWRNQF
jgi:hydroxyacylglutathione hydrolase